MLDARRRAVLDAMGIELWRSRATGEAARVEELAPRAEGQGSGAEGREQRAEVEQASAEAAAGAGSTADLTRNLDPSSPTPESSALGPRPSALGSVGPLDWSALQQAVASCRACGLHEARTQTVFGVGDRQARLMVIGEAPGAEEDRQGEPFVGRAGQLLNAMLEAIGFARDQVYIANIVKCRPPGNRDPHAEEAAACRPYLLRQIELIQPALILSAGRVSAHNLLGTDLSVGRLRGRVHRLDPGDVPLIVTYHPAYLLRRPQEKAKSWQDLQSAWRLLNGT